MTEASIPDQLLWLESLFKGVIGLALVLVPVLSAKVVGLPHGNAPLWPRLFGAALIGIALAFAVEGYDRITARGLGLGGAIAINFVTVVTLFGVLLFNGAKTRRASIFLTLIIFACLALMLFEIAHA